MVPVTDIYVKDDRYFIIMEDFGGHMPSKKVPEY